MVLRDGVPMTDPDSFSRFDFIDTQDIERIEITKGPGSLYGSGAAGGTIQIISKSVFDTQDNRVKLGLGNQGQKNLHARLAGEINDNNALALTASRREADNDWRDWNEFKSQQVSLKHGLRLGNEGTLIDIGFRYDRNTFDIDNAAYGEYDWGTSIRLLRRPRHHPYRQDLQAVLAQAGDQL